MGIFDDKKFESLDWISQTTEPIDSELNEVLGSIPEEIVVDFDTFKAMVGESSYLELTLDRMINYAVDKYSNKVLTWEQKRAIGPCFEIYMDEAINLDFENQRIDGDLKLIKLQSTMDEKVLESLLGREGISALSSMYFHKDGLTRANDVMEILGKCDEGLRTRSERKKKFAIQHRVTQLFKDNEWMIKDTELANKVGRWIREYVVDGNAAAYANFCKLKVMTHKGLPIYSMEEVE